MLDRVARGERTELNQRERWSTALLVALVAATSVSGLLANVYAGETSSWRLEALGQDIANLLSLPLLIAAAYLAARGSLKARLVWAGVLLFMLYAFVVYAFAAHFNRLFLVYVATLGLSVYTLLLAALHFDPQHATAGTVGGWRSRLVGGFLVVVAALFAFLWLSEDVPAVLAGVAPATVQSSGLLTNPIHVLDLAFILPGADMIGLQLWQGRPWGFALAAPLLVFMALTGIGIVAALVLSSGAIPGSAVLMSVIVLACIGLSVFHLAGLGPSVKSTRLRMVA